MNAPARRILLVKTALDGHWRGLSVVARALRDEGFHVIMGGMITGPEIVRAAIDEDVDLVGLNVGGHAAVVERVIGELRQARPELPIFAGGVIRWLVDRHLRKKHEARGVKLTDEELAAEGDKSPGVLMASGYIAGGAIAGIVIAFTSGVLDQFDAAVGDWAKANNPFFEGPASDLLSMLPFVLICGLLYAVGREWWLKVHSPPPQ